MHNLQTVGISMGNCCEAAIWGCDNQVRLKKEDGYKTCPFDLCVSNYNGVVDCINNDFRDFTNPDYLLLTSTHNNILVRGVRPNEKLIFNTKYNFCFNHESPFHADLYLSENWPNGPDHYIMNNFQLFLERYNRRINNFIEYLNTPNIHILFIFCFFDPLLNDGNEFDFSDLKCVLEKKYPLLQYSIRVI
jgi:hypothetical protein